MNSIDTTEGKLYETPFGWWTAEVCAKAKPYWGCNIRPDGTFIKYNLVPHMLPGGKEQLPTKVNYEIMNFQIHLMRAEMRLNKNPYFVRIEEYIDEAIVMAKKFGDQDMCGLEYENYHDLVEDVTATYNTWYGRNYKRI